MFCVPLLYLFSHVSLHDCAFLHPLLLLWKAKTASLQSAAPTACLKWRQSTDSTSKYNLHPFLHPSCNGTHTTQGLYSQLNGKCSFSEALISWRRFIKDSSRGRMGTYFHDISRTWIKMGSTSSEPCHWNPHKSAKWHDSSRFIRDQDNETLCGSLFQQQKPYSGAMDENLQ